MNLKIFIASVCSFFSVCWMQSQTGRGQHVLTVGEGFSMTSTALRVAKDVVNVTDANVVLNTTPVLNVCYDVALDDLVSLGVAYAYQDFRILYDKYNSEPGITITGKFEDRLTKENIALRPLLHLIDGKKVDGYIGLRVGYTRWTYNSVTIQDYSTQKYFSNSGSAQGILGIRYYPTKNFGLNAELAIGAPYAGMFGLNLRFGKKKE